MVKKGDAVLVISIAFLVISGFIGMNILDKSSKHRIAEIIHNNEVIRTIDLSSVTKPEKIKIPGQYDEVVAVEKGRIRFEEATCPDLVCVARGWLTKVGDSAVCIPNRTMIRIKGVNEELDAVTY
ncbi:MAG: NusG domain II-containing protein [Clostridia bacterium]|nr:NusG domain II-containing protein [Clostridia bacterium]